MFNPDVEEYRAGPSFVRDTVHTGNVPGALDLIVEGDTRARLSGRAKPKMLAALAGTGRTVTPGDPGAGAFASYSQAGQKNGTALLWMLLLIAPVSYVTPGASPVCLGMAGPAEGVCNPLAEVEIP